MTNYEGWVSVVTSDDQTPIWSGPRENAEAWLESPQGQSMARALSHRNITLVVTEKVKWSG